MRKLDDQNGFTLIGVMVILVILSVLGLSIVTLALGSVKVSSGERDEESAYYIAEAGLTYELSKIKNNIEVIYANENNADSFFDELQNSIIGRLEITDFEKTFGNQPKASVVIEQLDDGQHETNLRNYKITSVGEVGSKKRAVSRGFSIKWKDKYVEIPYELPPLAVYTTEDIVLSNGPIKGSIGTRSKGQHVINVGQGAKILDNGKIYVPTIDSTDENKTCKTTPTQDYKSFSVKRPEWEDNVPCPYEVEDKNMWEFPELPSFPETPVGKIPGNEKVGDHMVINNGNLLITHSDANNYVYNMQEKTVKFTKISLNANRKLTINVGDTDRNIVVEHLNLENGQLKVKGGGKLTFYVTSKITFESGSRLNENGIINNVNIFYQGTDPIKLAGSQKIYGSIHAKSANIDLTAGGSIYGNIFTGGEEVAISGGADVKTQLILAPEANVKTSGGGDVYGVIISRRFEHDSGKKVVYGEPFVLDGPISPSALSIESGGSKEDTEAKPIIDITPIREN